MTECNATDTELAAQEAAEKITVDAIFADPHRFGFPTVEEYAKNPEKYRRHLSERLGQVDQSTKLFKNLLCKQTYRLGKYVAKTLEEIERIAIGEGINLMECKLGPTVIPQVGGKVDIEVEFIPPKQPTFAEKIMRGVGNWIGR